MFYGHWQTVFEHRFVQKKKRWVWNVKPKNLIYFNNYHIEEYLLELRRIIWNKIKRHWLILYVLNLPQTSKKENYSQASISNTALGFKLSGEGCDDGFSLSTCKFPPNVTTYLRRSDGIGWHNGFLASTAIADAIGDTEWRPMVFVNPFPSLYITKFFLFPLIPSGHSQ